MAQMAAEERIALIKENLAEWLDFDMIEKIINEGKDPKVYWGTYVTPEHDAPVEGVCFLPLHLGPTCAPNGLLFLVQRDALT